MKILQIPEKFQIGAVIGKKGSTIKAVQAEFGVRARVIDSSIILQGGNKMEQKAADHYLKMFAEYSLSKQAEYPHADAYYYLLRDGPEFCWQFKRAEVNNSPDTQDYPYVLVRDISSARSATTSSPSIIEPGMLLNFDKPSADYIEEKVSVLDKSSD
jgi:KH domain